ncbi:MAG: 4Fe-4S binding protein [Prevotellaceae bacterium]|jgi:MinD superfamily P-loop ATPase|nr:4Fe-4S binding protein [Prevotellaceae bacterium]
MLGKKTTPNISAEKCTACGRCQLACQRNAIGLAYEKYSVCAKLMYPERCSGCGKCAKHCSAQAIEMTKSEKQKNTAPRFKKWDKMLAGVVNFLL